jgi:hypothetical protein
MYSPNESVQKRVRDAWDLFADDSECWVWPKSKTKAGYGQLTTSNGSAKSFELHYAHRVSFFLKNGSFERKTYICHRCDNPSCFNPSHLFAGTPLDNNLDCKRKGRNNAGKKLPQGNRHWSRRDKEKVKATFVGVNNVTAKLNPDAVREIRASNETGVALAERFGVTSALISSVRKNKIWKSVQ